MERKRFPDAIGIGIAKSGTGSMAFLDCHSKIRFRALEPAVFPLQCTGVKCRAGKELSSESFPLDIDDVYSDHFPFTYWSLVKGTIKGKKGWVFYSFESNFD